MYLCVSQSIFNVMAEELREGKRDTTQIDRDIKRDRQRKRIMSRRGVGLGGTGLLL